MMRAVASIDHGPNSALITATFQNSVLIVEIAIDTVISITD